MASTEENHPWHDAETLTEMYVEEGMTQKEIADEFDCSRAAIGKWMRRNNIPTREGGNPPEKTPWRDAELLREWYVEKGLSQREIAEAWGCSQKNIYKWLHRHGIETRPPSRDLPVHYFTHEDGYELWKHDRSDEIHYVRVHRLLAVAEYGFEEVAGKEIHHKNKIKWDNRPENIVPLTVSEHRQVHWDEGDMR